jgi:uncharacterized protein (TIGR03437 family)
MKIILAGIVCLCIQMTAAAQSDLVIQNLAVTPQSGAAGARVTLSFTIRNQGNGAASASTTNIRLNTSSSNVTTGDPLLAGISTPAIPAGGAYQISRTVTIPVNSTPGAHFLWVILDVNSTASQSNESNDKASIPFTVVIPSDLAPQNLIVTPNKGQPGTSVAFSFAIRNQGAGSAAASITRIWLNTSSSTVSSNDYLLASINVPALAAGAAYGVAQILNIPTGRNPGTHYIWVVVDADSTAIQSNENNDKARVSFTVIPPPSDLIVQNLIVNPASGKAGARPTVSFTIRNQGIGTANPSTTHLRLSSSSSNVTTSDTLLLSLATPAIAAGGNYSVSNRSVTLPLNKPPGTYYVWVIADVYHRASQSDESNDKANSPFTIDCVAPAITVHPVSRVISSGQKLTLTVAASGSLPLSFQWYKGTSGDTSNPLSGATASSFITPALTSITSYWVRVSNACGSASSRAALITVSTPNSLALDVIDPACSSSFSTCTGTFLKLENSQVIPDPDPKRLATASARRSGIVTDGVTLLLLRVRSETPVTFRLRTLSGEPADEKWGTLRLRTDTAPRGNMVTANPEAISATVRYAFAVFQAPPDFPATSAAVSTGVVIEAESATSKASRVLGLRPPPLMLIHGVWSNGDAWQGLADDLKKRGFDICGPCLLDYGSFQPAVSFDPVSPRAEDQFALDLLDAVTRAARRAMQAKGVAVTQVDVIGHSLGGLLARARVKYRAVPENQPKSYLRLDNYHKGDFHRLITVGSPHLGTPLADWLLEKRCVRTSLGVRFETALASRWINKPIGPAIFGFQTRSVELINLGTTRVPSHAIYATEPPISATKALLNAILFLAPLLPGDVGTIDGILGPQGPHDTIVPVTSQRGNINPMADTYVPDLVHARHPGPSPDTGETESEEVWKHIHDLLLTSVNSEKFAYFPQFVPPSGAPITNVPCSGILSTEPEPESAAITAEGVLTPAPGTVVPPDEVVTIHFAITEAEGVNKALIRVGDELRLLDGPAPFTFSYPIPANRAGKLEIFALGFGAGAAAYSAETYLTVAPDSTLDHLSVTPDPLVIEEVGERLPLRVIGQYEDETEINLTASAAGTAYATQSGTDKVVTVSADGLVEAHGFGRETIVITNSGRTAKVEVKVVPPDSPASVEVTSTSAASYETSALASESIVAAFGSELATTTSAASGAPLPVTLAGTTVTITDSVGTEHAAPLFFVSPNQINYLIPPAAATGPALVKVAREDGVGSFGTMLIEPVTPGLFTADASGQGLAAAVALRVKADGSQTWEPVVRFDPAQNRIVATPIDLGSVTDQVFLILFGTGIRFRSDLTTVSAKIGGVDAEVLYAGEQGGFVGLDQVNIRLPRSLAGRGEVDVALTVDGKPANIVRVSIR